MHDMTKQPQVSPRAVSVIEKSHSVPQAFCRSYAAIVALRRFPKPPHQVAKSREKKRRDNRSAYRAPSYIELFSNAQTNSPFLSMNLSHLII